MKMQLSTEAVLNALADALAHAWSARAGSAAVGPLAAPESTDGWLASFSFTGTVTGPASIWFERESAQACLRAVRPADGAPADAEVESLLGEIVTDAVAAFASRAPFTGAVASQVEMVAGVPGAGSQAFEISAAGMPAWRVACWADVTAAAAEAAAPNDDRLSAVLEVELPLVVRFGRAVMPFRALASLGPGSVVDMGRSPEEPVELLVGERLIARGEVVIVGGNYGVRITELTGARPIPGMEAR